MFGFFSAARANKENILYTILTIFLLERVRRGWNRIENRGRAANVPGGEIEKKQQTFMFGAGLLYALPCLLPIVKYIYRSIDELAGYVGDLSVLTNLWAFVVVLVIAELFLGIVIYNLLGIYVDRMNAALGFFRKIGRSVIDGSRVAVQTGTSAGGRAATGVRDAAVVAAMAGRTALSRGASSTRTAVSLGASSARRVAHQVGRPASRLLARLGRPAAPLVSRLGRTRPAKLVLTRIGGAVVAEGVARPSADSGESRRAA